MGAFSLGHWFPVHRFPSFPPTPTPAPHTRAGIIRGFSAQTHTMEAERLNQIKAQLQDLAQRTLELRGYL